MPELRDQLTIIFSFELGAAVLSMLLYGLALFSFWSSETKIDERKRKIIGSCLLAGAFVFGWALFALIEVRRLDESVTRAVIQSIVYIRFIYFAAAAAATAFGLSKFYMLHDTPTWVFVISSVVSLANLSAATYTSVNNEAQRWEFFGVSAAFAVVALAVQTLCDHIKGWSTVAETEEDSFARGFVRLWVLIVWALIYLVWFLGPFGLDAGFAGNHVFEQSCYLVFGFLGFLVTAVVVLFTFTPASESIRKSKAYHALAHESTRHTRRSAFADK